MSDRLAVALAYFSVFVGAGVWVPYFPLYLSHLGYGSADIGLVIGMQPGLRWCGAMGWAWAADRWRIRHAILIATTIGGTVFLTLLLVAHELKALVAVLALVSLLHGAVIPMLDATVMDHLSRLGDNYGRLRLWGSLGFVIGSAGAAPLVHSLTPAVVPMLILIPCVAMIPAVWRLPRGQHEGHAAFAAPWTLLTPALSIFLFTSVLLQISCGTWSGFFAVHTASLRLPDTVPGFTYGIAVTAEIALMYWGRPLLERVAPAALIQLALVATVIRWLLSAWVETLVPVVAVQVGHVFSFSLFHLAALRLLAQLVPRERSTTGQALYGGVSFGIGGSGGLALAGFLVDRFGTHGAFAAEAAVALTALVPAGWLARSVRSR